MCLLVAFSLYLLKHKNSKMDGGKFELSLQLINLFESSNVQVLRTLVQVADFSRPFQEIRLNLKVLLTVVPYSCVTESGQYGHT